MSNVEFLIAAYAVTIVGLIAYVFYLRRQQAAVSDRLAAAPDDRSPGEA